MTARTGTAAHFTARLALGLVTFFFLGALIVERIAANVLHGDSPTLVAGAKNIQKCLTSPDAWGSCSDIGIFAPLQYIPAGLMANFGLADDQMLDGLAALNALALLGAVWLSWELFKDRPRIAALAVLTLLASPLIWYAGASYSEGLAPVLFIGLIYVLVTNRGVAWIIALAALATMSKDTAVPFVILIGVIALVTEAERSMTATRRRRGIALGVGIAIGMIAVVALNLVRWGTVMNEAYNIPEYRTPAGQVANSFLGLWASPNGGLIIFWPLAAALLLGAGVNGISRIVKAPRDVSAWWRPIAIFIGAVVLHLLLATWYAPFGWTAWGPRLSLPVVAGMAFLTLWACADTLTRVLDWLRRAWIAGVAATALVVALALPNFGAVLNPTVKDLPLPQDLCPVTTAVTSEPDRYYQCLRFAMWDLEPIGLSAVKAVWASATSIGFLVLFACTLLVLSARAIAGPTPFFTRRFNPKGTDR